MGLSTNHLTLFILKFFGQNKFGQMFGAKLSWCQIVRCQIVLVPKCPLLLSWCQIVLFYYLGAKLSALLSWCQIVRCQIVRINGVSSQKSALLNQPDQPAFACLMV